MACTCGVADCECLPIERIPESSLPTLRDLSHLNTVADINRVIESLERSIGVLVAPKPLFPEE